jgi:adenylate kinase family enzyme
VSPSGGGRPDNGRMRRIWVRGNSGSGKTTLARQLAAALGVPHLELDGVFHQPGWQPLPDEEFRARVAEFVAADAWVVDGNYRTALGNTVAGRADTLIFLDPPRHRVMRQVIGRTLRRMARREELWNGNRERWANLFRLDPQESIIMWAWTQHGRYREKIAAARADPALAHLEFIRLTSRAQVADLVARVGAGTGAGTDRT